MSLEVTCRLNLRLTFSDLQWPPMTSDVKLIVFLFCGSHMSIYAKKIPPGCCYIKILHPVMGQNIVKNYYIFKRGGGGKGIIIFEKKICFVSLSYDLLNTLALWNLPKKKPIYPSPPYHRRDYFAYILLSLSKLYQLVIILWYSH